MAGLDKKKKEKKKNIECKSDILISLELTWVSAITVEVSSKSSQTDQHTKGFVDASSEMLSTV